jgi:translocation and assembly module TamB
LTDATSPPDTAAETPPPRKPARSFRPKSLIAWILAVAAAALVIGSLALLGVRYGVLTPQARILIEARTDGLKLGRFGRLKLEGIEGDIWRKFTVRRLTISDEGGVWLEARRVGVTWSYGELLRRRLDVDSLTAEQIRLLRRPTLGPKGVSRGMPVSVTLDHASGRLEMLPAFSYERGVYDLDVRNLQVGRGGGFRVGLAAKSLLHAGDFLRVEADMGRDKSLKVQADALEAQGGSIAGALGLDPKQPFSLTARVSGNTSLGKLSLTSRSGAIVPLRAGGAWSPDGGAVNARLLLTSSRLLEGWRRRFGPEALFDIVGRKRPDGLHNLALTLKAENLILTAQGPADMDQRRTAGLKVQATIRDLTPLFSFPELGRAEGSGVISGTVSDWRFAGPVQVFDVVNDDYRIARVYGPSSVTFKNGEFDILADVKTQGSGGSGWQWAVAGPSPSARVHLSRLKDGRMLYRSIDADGRGLKLRGDGTQSVFNELHFRGDVQVYNLEQAHEGAGGSARFNWTATQKNIEAPWVLTFDGGGDKFTSGYAELDRLMGRNPRVKGEASILRGEVKMPKVVLTGANANLDASGVQHPNGQIVYTGTWTAKGPFLAGPVEVAGDMRGKANLTGTWLEPKADLTAELESLDLPRLKVQPGAVAFSFVRDAEGVMVGGIGLQGGSAYGPARFKSGFRFAEDGLDLQGIDADLGGVRATGALSLRASTPSSADLTIAIGPGALLTQGQVNGTVRIVDGAGGPTASVRLETSGAVVRDPDVVLQKGSIVADGPLSRLPYRITAAGAYNRNPLAVEGGGIVSEDKGRWDVSFEGTGALRATRFQTLEPIQARFGDGGLTAHALMTLGGGRASVDWRQEGDTVKATAALDGVDVRVLSEDFVGRFDADMQLDGKGRALNGRLTARLNGARSRDAPANLGIDGQVQAVLQDDRLTIEGAASNGQGLRASVNLALAAVADAKPFRIAIARNEAMRGRYSVEGEVQPLWDLFLGGERTLGGRLVSSGDIGGSLNDPEVTGQASLTGGRFEDYATGLRLTNVDMQADLRGDLIRVERFTGQDGVRGTVSGSGRVSLERNGASDFSLKLASFRLIDNELAQANATGQVTLTRGGNGAIKIVGELGIDEAEVNAAAQLAANVATMDVVEINRPIALQNQLTPLVRRGPGANLDVRLRAPRRVYVRGRGLDVEMSLNAHVTGTTALPNLEGEARIVRGTYEFAGKAFEFDDHGLVRLSTRPEQIRLDLQAVREDPSLTAVVRILGTAAKPEITLTSSPALPNDEVLSQVLFGRSASQLSPLEAAQLASALSGLASGGGFDVIGNLRTFAGLDRLAFAGGGPQALSVAGGKYLTDDVYLEIAGGGRDGPSAEVEYRVSRSLSILSRLTSEAGARLSVRWRRDLGDGRRGRR